MRLGAWLAGWVAVKTDVRHVQYMCMFRLIRLFFLVAHGHLVALRAAVRRRSPELIAVVDA